MKTWVAAFFLIGCLLFILTGPLWTWIDEPSVLARAPHGRPAEVAGFIPDGPVWHNPPPPGLETESSWILGEGSTGRLTTESYRPANRFDLYVAGYPNTPGNSLSVELDYPNGGRKAIALHVPDSGDAWKLRHIDIGPVGDSTAMRIVAVDGSAQVRGWLALSLPVKQPWRIFVAAEALAKSTLTICAMLTFLLAPGFLLRARRQVPLPLVPLPGILLLISWGLVTWLLRIDGGTGGVWFVGFALSALFVAAYFRLRPAISRTERKVGVLMLLVIAIACGKATYSLGPPGELYFGRIDRSNEIGGRSDSHIQFHVVQLVANSLSIYSQESFALFAPWAPTFRGPIAGMAAAPLVLLTNPSVPKTAPDQDWAPFDTNGFAVYRIFMICLSACSLLVFHGLAQAVGASPSQSLLATALLAGTPFWVHEVYFTWPKLFCVSLILMALFLALRGRYLLAGLVWGLSYLAHPLAPFSAPVLLLAIAAERIRTVKSEFWRRELVFATLWRSAVSGAILMAVALLWETLFRTGRSPFWIYVLLTDFHPATSLSSWILNRAHSVASTLVPLFVVAPYSADPNVNAVASVSSPLVHFYFSYWNTLPFAIGFSVFFPWCSWMARLGRRFIVVFLAVVVAPFVLFAIYWGADHSGLMREGLHPWFFTLFLFLIWGASREDGVSRRIAGALRMLQPLRTAEVLGMLLATTVVQNFRLLDPTYAGSDAVALAAMVGASLVLGWTISRIASDFITDEEKRTTQPAQTPARKHAVGKH